LTRLLTLDRASPALLLLNWNIYKWRTTSRVWYLEFDHVGVFIWVNGASTDLDRWVWRQVVVGGHATWSTGWVERPAPTFSTDSGFSSSCRDVATKAETEPPQTLAIRLRSWADRLTPLPTWPGVWPTWSTYQIHPRGDDDFDI
jgi:hypothetical protein